MDDERWEPGMPVLDRQAVPEPALRVPPVTGAHKVIAPSVPV